MSSEIDKKKSQYRGLKPFPKGKSGNPGGVPKKDLVVKAFRECTYQEFIQNLQKYGWLTREQMAEELRRPDATMFELMFGNIVASAAKGDDRARTILIERLWGKVKEEIDFKMMVQKVPDSELIDRYQSILERAKAATISIEATEVKNELDNVDNPSDLGDPANSTVDKRDNYSD